MKTIRMGVFETNSSSTHCLVLASEEDFKKFEASDAVMNTYQGNIWSVEDALANLKGKVDYDTVKDLTVEEFKFILEHDDDASACHYSDYDDYSDVELSQDMIDAMADTPHLTKKVLDLVYEWIEDDKIMCYRKWCDQDEYETFEEHKTINGVEVVALGYYGYGC